MFQLFSIFLLLIIVTAIIKKWEEKQYQNLNSMKNNNNISEYEFYKLKEELETLKEKILKLEFILNEKNKD